MSEIIFKVAKTKRQLEQCFSIRYSVFVVEQKMFKKTDQDEFDNDAIHIAAINSDDGNVISTVRCYKVGDNIWYGSRLAVPKEYRNHHSRIGVKLCKLAEKTVAEHGAKQFLAYIQIKNVRFFEGLRWRKIDTPIMHLGVQHQLMEASLLGINKNSEISIQRKIQPVYVPD